MLCLLFFRIWYLLWYLPYRKPHMSGAMKSSTWVGGGICPYSNGLVSGMSCLVLPPWGSACQTWPRSDQPRTHEWKMRGLCKMLSHMFQPSKVSSICGLVGALGLCNLPSYRNLGASNPTNNMTTETAIHCSVIHDYLSDLSPSLKSNFNICVLWSVCHEPVW